MILGLSFLLGFAGRHWPGRLARSKRTKIQARNWQEAAFEIPRGFSDVPANEKTVEGQFHGR